MESVIKMDRPYTVNEPILMQGPTRKQIRKRKKAIETTDK
jgi:hypothetical protein